MNMDSISSGGIRAAKRYVPADDLCIITCFFNSEGYQNKTRNLHVYLDSIKSSGLNFFFVEGAFGNQPFMFEESPKVVQVRCNDILWQKERLLNLALSRLSRKYTKVAWLDADVLFENPLWAVEASHLLERYPLIQLFETGIWLPKGHREYSGSGMVYKSFCYCCQRWPGIYLNGVYDTHGHVGWAWAANRELLERHGLFDAQIAGGGDHLVAHAAVGDWTSPCVENMVGAENSLSGYFSAWAERFYSDVRGNVSHVPGTLLHLWHGDKANRQYYARHRELNKLGFDPRQDIKIGETGGWEWSSSRSDLHAWGRRYFTERNEDAPSKEQYVPPDARAARSGNGNGNRRNHTKRLTHALYLMAPHLGMLHNVMAKRIRSFESLGVLHLPPYATAVLLERIESSLPRSLASTKAPLPTRDLSARKSEKGGLTWDQMKFQAEKCLKVLLDFAKQIRTTHPELWSDTPAEKRWDLLIFAHGHGAERFQEIAKESNPSFASDQHVKGVKTALSFLVEQGIFDLPVDSMLSRRAAIRWIAAASAAIASLFALPRAVWGFANLGRSGKSQARPRAAGSPPYC